MISAKVEVDKASRAKLDSVMKQFMATTGKTAEEGVGIVAFSSGRRLVNTVQPFGLKPDRFVENIRAQIEQVRWEVNSGVVPENDIQTAHNRARRQGRVRLRSIRSKTYNDIITKPEAEAYIRKQQEKAGRVKAAWVTAVNAIGKSRMSGIPQWITRHVGSRYGNCIKTGEGLRHEITLENSVPYMTERLQSQRNILAAAADGLKNGYKRIQIIINKEIEKANRAMQ